MKDDIKKTSKFFDKTINSIIKENGKKNDEYKYFFNRIMKTVRKEIEYLWQTYEEYAPKGFKKNAVNSINCFNERWWEMFLGNKLLEDKYELIKENKKDEGPDFKLCIENTIYWIENVSPEMGNNNNENQLPKIKKGVNQLPKKQFLLRLNNSLENKAKKFRQYTEKGIVKKDDIKIIAVCTANLSHYGSLMDYPKLAIETLLNNIGTLDMDLNTGEIFIASQDGIIVKSKEEIKVINTDFFRINSDIDGIIYTNADPLNSKKKIYFIKNPYSKVSNDFLKE